MSEYSDFMIETLIPASNKVLQEKYNDYCAGKDIGVETKEDASPASTADREAEKILRELISKKYPDHGIWGEEYGAENLDAEFVWVLDPLDGTREFLAKKPGQFGTLIGLMKNGKAIEGIISDPFNQKIWFGEKSGNCKNTPLNEATLSCTNPDGMFHQKGYGAEFDRLANAVSTIQTGLNCIGFAKVADREINLAVENSLALHDIAALIPALDKSGCTVMDLDGNSYSEMIFDMKTAGTKKYGMIAASSLTLARQALKIMKEDSI